MEIERTRPVGASLPPPPKHVRAHNVGHPGGHAVNQPVVHGEQVAGSPNVKSVSAEAGSGRHARTESGTQRGNVQPHPQRASPVSPVHENKLTLQQKVNNNIRLDKGWTSFEDNQGLVSGSQEDKDKWAHFSDVSRGESSSTKYDTSSISSAESVDDIWCMTDEQRDYYIKQFTTMQSDLSGVISGAVAKEFFEKSKLPVQELSRIWQLSDFNRDGALSLDEFCTAMHLVVLRRNDIELPDSLPPSLVPYTFLNTDEPFSADLPQGSTLKRLTPPSPVMQWQPDPATIPVESPTSSSVSSPGQNKPTPVNFEVQPVTADPESKIIQPKAMKISPEFQPVSQLDNNVGLVDGAGSSSGDDQAPPSPTKPRSDSLVDTHPPMVLGTPLQSRPRPTPKKASVSGPVVDMTGSVMLRPPPMSSGSAAPDQPAERPSTLAVGEDSAPPPPPRPSIGATATDDDSDDGQSLQPPAIPPRPLTKEDISERLVSAESMEDDDQLDQLESVPNRKRFIPDDSEFSIKEHKRSVSLDYSAMENRRREKTAGQDPGVRDHPVPIRRYSADELTPDGSETSRKALPRAPSLDKKDIQAAVRWQKERNRVLSQLNSELNQELQEIMEQRIALEIQLEHLRPFSS